MKELDTYENTYEIYYNIQKLSETAIDAISLGNPTLYPEISIPEMNPYIP